MATWQATNVLTGQVEGPKQTQYNVTEIWIASVGSTWASGDVVNGPTIPPNVYLQDVKVDVDSLDSGGSPTAAFEVGYFNTGSTVAAAFIATGNTTAQAGGIQGANVPGTVGFTNALACTVQAKFTANPVTGATGKFRFAVSYTTNP